MNAQSRQVLLDASSLIALVRGEPGADRVESILDHAAISIVNWCETHGRLIQKEVPDMKRLRADLVKSGLKILPFKIEHSDIAAEMITKTKSAGISLADRACLATAIHERILVYTADRAWQKLDLDVEIQLIR